jgi:hypothetical protein
MKLALVSLAAVFSAMTLTTALSAHAQTDLSTGAETDLFHADKHSNSCRAEAIERFYCPDGFTWGFPHFDNGCRVTCAANQKPVCVQATCEAGQTGNAIPSSCTCK